MPETRFGTFEELLADTAEPLKPIVEALRAMVFEVDSGAVEVVRLGDRAATYGVGLQKAKDGYAYVLPHKSHVNLGFFRAGELVDPDGLLEGTGKSMRHVKVCSIEAANSPALRALVAGAFAERKAARG